MTTTCTQSAEDLVDAAPRILARVLLVASVAGTAAMLVVSPGAPADVSFVPLLLAVVPLVGLIVLEHRSPTISPRLVVAAAGGLLVLAVVQPPHGSGDVWSYAMYGRLVVAHHVSPYTHVPAAFPSDPALARVSPGWRGTPSVYGPGFTVLSAGIMAVAGVSGLAARLGFQAMAAAALLAIAAVLVRRRVPTAALAAVLLNPLILVWVVNGGHNDALLGLSLLLAALAMRSRPGVAGLLLAAAVLVKAVAVFPAVACVVWVWRHSGRRAAALVASAVAAPVLAAYAASGGLAAIAPLFGAASHQSRVSVWRLLPDGDAWSVHSVGVLAAVAVVALTAVLVATRLGEASAAPVLVASLAGYLLLAGYILPWYFAWILPVAALDAQSRLSRLLAAQTVAILMAYQYRAVPHGDALDHLLHASVTLAQLVAVAGSLALVVAAVATSRRRAVPVPVTPS
jgi:alpha-1,6-mannosyltransferase